MELAALCERYRVRFIASHARHTTQAQWSALNALLGCHTEQYGTLSLSCQRCSQEAIRYRSCGHRFCNQCQQHSTQMWLNRQTQKLLPVDYYLVTFTLPFELRAVAKAHSTTVLTLLMQCAAATLIRFGLNAPGLQAQLGMCAVLHTHTRRLDYHPHVHLVVPGGGLNVERNEWRKLKGKYLFNVKAMSSVFRGRFIAALKEQLPKEMNSDLLRKLYKHKWVVYAKRPFTGPQSVVEYLGRYTHKIAISNHRITAIKDGKVSFRYKDYADGCQQKTMTLEATEFLRRFCLHLLPKGFRKIRHYGFLSNRCGPAFKKHQMQMGVVPATKQETSWQIITQTKLQYDIHQCPNCKKGKMEEVLSFDINGPPQWLINKLRSQTQQLSS